MGYICAADQVHHYPVKGPHRSCTVTRVTITNSVLQIILYKNKKAMASPAPRAQGASSWNKAAAAPLARGVGVAVPDALPDGC